MIPEPYVDASRFKLAVLLSCDEPERVRRHRCTTPVQAGMLEAWAAKAEGPGIGTVDWLKHGALAGISQCPVLPGMFPTVDAESDVSLDPLE